MNYIKICPYCNVEFKTTNNNKIYCNPYHSTRNWAENSKKSCDADAKRCLDKWRITYTKICPYCKIEFKTTRANKIACCPYHNMRNWCVTNKNKHNENAKRYRNKFPEKRQLIVQTFKFKHPKYHTIWNRNAYQTDEQYRLKNILYVVLNNALKRQNSPKYFHALDLIGCSPSFLNNYLEQQMTDEMKNNREKIDIDHIIPINVFNLNSEEEQQKCFHYTNLRPMLRKDNQSRPKDGSDVTKI